MENGLRTNLETNALKLGAFLLLAFALAFLAYYGLNAVNDPVFAIDFSPYYVAGKLLASGQAQALIPQAAQGMFTTTAQPFLEEFHKHFFPTSPVATGWIYPAAYAWLFRPFAGLSFASAAGWWLGLNVVLTCLSIALVLWARPWQGDPRYRILRAAWIVFLGLTFQPILDNLWHGNISALWLLFFCLFYFLLRRNSPLLAGLALGLIVPLKFTPALIVLYYLWRKNWRVVAGALLGSLVIVLGTWLTTGLNGLLQYASLIMAQLQAGGVAAFNNQSLSGFLLHVFTRGDVNGWETIPVPAWIALLRYALILGLLVTVIWTMRRRPGKLGQPLLAEDLDLGLLLGVMLLASPVSWYHHYVIVFLPLVFVFDHLLAHPGASGRLVLFALAYGLLVMQGFSPVRGFAPQAIQDVWILRVLISSSFLGEALFLGLILRLRAEIR